MTHKVFELMAVDNHIISLRICSFYELILRKSVILLVINGLITYYNNSIKLWLLYLSILYNNRLIFVDFI